MLSPMIQNIRVSSGSNGLEAVSQEEHSSVETSGDMLSQSFSSSPSTQSNNAFRNAFVALSLLSASVGAMFAARNMKELSYEKMAITALKYSSDNNLRSVSLTSPFESDYKLQKGIPYENTLVAFLVGKDAESVRSQAREFIAKCNEEFPWMASRLISSLMDEVLQRNSHHQDLIDELFVVIDEDRDGVVSELEAHAFCKTIDQVVQDGGLSSKQNLDNNTLIPVGVKAFVSKHWDFFRYISELAQNEPDIQFAFQQFPLAKNP